MMAPYRGLGRLAWFFLVGLGSGACSGSLTAPEEQRLDGPGAGDDDDGSELPTDGADPTADAPDRGRGGAADAGPGDRLDPGADSPDATGADPADEVDPPSRPTQTSTPSDSVAPRLTQAELNNTLRDLLGDDTSPASQYLAEDEFAPYDNDATRQTVSAALIDSMQVLAENVAARAARDPRARSSWMPCEPQGASDVACFDQAVMDLTRLFFRRPIPDEQLVSYRTLLDFAEEQDDFYVSIELLLASLLQDPEFLYRLERGANANDGMLQLDGYEVATRLSFLLLGSAPSRTLLDEAEAGALVTTEGRRNAAQQLLATNAARRQLNRFHAMWLGYRAIPHDAELNAAFQLETQTLIEQVVFDEPQNYLNLFTSPTTYVSELLAEHYGLPEPSGGVGWVSYPSGSGRAGILSHGSVLSAFSKFSDTSPTQRGIFVRTRLLCQEVPPPPPTVDVDQPPSAEESAGSCKLDRYRAHREQSGCAECHSLFDPIGEGLENYDMAGRYREHDDDDESCVIDAVGALPGYGEFRGPAELAALLTEEAAIGDCFVRQYLQYSLAKGALTSAERQAADDLSTAFTENGYMFDQWLLELVSAERFAQKQEDDQ